MRNKLNYLVLNGAPAIESLWKYAETDTCHIEPVFIGSDSMILSGLRLLLNRFKRFPQRIWIRKPSSALKDATCVIFMDSCNSYRCLWRYMKEKKTGQRFIYYYWNKVERCAVQPDVAKNLGYETWSFDKEDCKEYGLSYNPSFYVKSWYENAGKIKERNSDVCYIGRDKDDRMAKVSGIMRELQKEGLSTYTYFTAPKWYKRFCKKEYKKYLDFKEMISKEMGNKCIFDFGLENQSGITLRVFDALCNGRKLITTNKAVMEYDFYDSKNVFVYGADDIKRIKDFVEDPGCISPKMENYCIDKWLERFN